MKNNYELGSIVLMKKDHPCGDNKFKIVRMGVDIKIKCEKCGRIDKGAISISESTVSAIRYIVMAPAKKLFSFSLKDESLNELKLVSKLYFDDKLER